MSKQMIELALQAMLGYKLGKWGADCRELCSTIGLKKEEWDHIKKNEDFAGLDKEDIQDINTYFLDNDVLHKGKET